MSAVSVIIPTHNRADLLPEAVRSVLAQTEPDFELIVVDDGSTDDTPGVMAGFASDTRVRYERQPQSGRSAARNRGAALARSELLGFLDSDDRYLPMALEAHRRAFEAQPSLGMTLGGYETIGLIGERLGERRPWEEDFTKLDISDWLFNCYGAPGSVMVRKAWFDRVGGFAAQLRMGEDYHFFLKLAGAGCPMGWVRKTVLQYRFHPGGSVHNLTNFYHATLSAIENYFRDGEVPAEARPLENLARAHVAVDFARKYFLAGQDEPAREALATAMQLNPRLAAQERIRVLEVLLAGEAAQERLPAETLVDRLRPVLPVSRTDLRQALARVAMGTFFRLSGPAPREARRYLWSGVRLDPRWLANRGVLSFIARQTLRGSNG